MQARQEKRCAIYTRKSCEDGLELEYNSLDAQYDSAEAYIRSQASNGWRVIPKRYDGGGFSGGNVNRPALKALMRDIENGEVDVVVVYKIDRLSRSLVDFTDLSKLFERHNVSFVGQVDPENPLSKTNFINQAVRKIRLGPDQSKVQKKFVCIALETAINAGYLICGREKRLEARVVSCAAERSCHERDLQNVEKEGLLRDFDNCAKNAIFANYGAGPPPAYSKSGRGKES